MPDVQTSRVLAVISRLYTLLSQETNWSSGPSGEKPLVCLGALGKAKSLEPIIIEGVPSRQPTIDFATVGQVGHDEQFAIRVYVGALTPGREGTEALERLGVLIATVETAVRDQTTGKPAGGFTGPGLGCLWWRVANITARFGPSTEGALGSADIDIVFRVRI